METRKTQPARSAVRIRPDGQSEYVQSNLIAISPLGVKFSATNLQIAQAIDLELVLSGDAQTHRAIVVATSADAATARFVTRGEAEGPTERRQATRWICPANFLPSAIASAPGQFNEFIQFRVTNVSRTGMELRTDSSNKFLVKGMILRLTVSLPMVGESSVLAKIVRIKIIGESGSDFLSIGCQILDIDEHAVSMVTQYLLQFSDIQVPSDFNGLKPVTDLRIEVSNVSLESELQNLVSNSARSVFSLWEDIEARVLSFKAKGLRGLLSIKFPNHESANAITPADIRPDQMVLIGIKFSAADKLTEYTVATLLGYVITSSLTAQRPYIVLSPDTQLQETFLRCGFKPVGDCLIGHPFGSLLEQHVRPLFWNIAWANAARSLADTRSFEFDGMSRRLYRIYRAMEPLADIWFKLTRNLGEIEYDINRG